MKQPSSFLNLKYLSNIITNEVVIDSSILTCMEILARFVSQS